MKTPAKVVNINSGNVTNMNMASSEKREDGMKVCRGPFNVNCTT